MKPTQIVMRVLLLVLLVSVVGVCTILVARAALPALAPQDTFDGSLSGQLTGVASIQTTRSFTITATGVSSGTTYFTSTTVSKLNPTYIFTPVGVSDFGGYGRPPGPITWTVQAIPPGSCYAISPAVRTAYLDQDNKTAAGLDFAVSYRAVPATVTVLMTEVVNFGLQPPANAVIEAPAQAAATNNLFDIQYKLTRSDGVTMLTSIIPANAPVQVPNLLASEAPDASCAWTYTVTVNAIRPYLNAVNWRFVPAGGAAVTLSSDNPSAQVGILAWHYWLIQPVVIRQ